ncbi:exonuclease domain-containing protein [Robbsia sp. Bb-Pol-6]|uniref:DNA-directed DNA polymerase n=1 Tax=Robbsia betulipollinis TaxID=2981849 RepID=A0ABT3ZPD5_9BURK|nr:exonuclease domain-containing protein [Robbsia betulipollinis]MCY0387800.1 exonuclease domain-containing protein [Robbsia betulipollinis]
MKVAHSRVDAPASAAPIDAASPATGAFDVPALLARLDRPMVFVDLETTGSDPLKDRITEIGLVEVGPEGLREWTMMVDPGQPIPPFIEQLTGISNAMVRGQPSFASLAPALAAQLEGKLFIAHNARFDYGFLKSEFKRAGLRFRADVLCTVRLSRTLFPTARKHGLDALIERFALVPRGRHRALADADLLWQFWQHLHRQHPFATIDAAARTLIRRASLPAALDEDALDSLPALPGVYVFYGAQGLPLFVGKGADLRKSVGAHFSADHRQSNDQPLSSAVRRIEHRVAAGETGAALVEAQLVKALAPPHNRVLRRRSTPCSWYFPPEASVPRLAWPHERDFGRTEDLFGIFDSRAKAESRLRKLARENGVYPAALGLEKDAPAWEAGELADDAADDVSSAEAAGAQAARLREALAPLRIACWPHDGPIAFAERHRTGLTQWHVVDNWSYLGSSEDPRALPGLAAATPVPLFDRDTYAILRRAFRDPTLDVLPLRVARALELVAPPAPAAPTVEPDADAAPAVLSRTGPAAPAATRARVSGAARDDRQLLIDFDAAPGDPATAGAREA